MHKGNCLKMSRRIPFETILRVTFALVVSSHLSVQDEAFCRARNGSLGFCISIKSQIKHCSSLLSWLKNGNETDYEKLRESICSTKLTETEARVCCPYKNYNEETRIENFGSYSKHQNFKLLPAQTACGNIGSSDRIIGGQNAKPGDFPWIARIGYMLPGDTEPYFFCSGTIINRRHVLTAAHCLTKLREPDTKWVQNDAYNTNEKIIVRLADSDDNLNPESITLDGTIVLATSPYIDAEVEALIIHEHYRDQNDYPSSDDIGLIRLKIDLNTTSPFVKPVCLPFLREYYLPKSLRNYNLIGQKVFIAGWGKTNNSVNVGSNTLQYLRVEIQSNIYCRIAYRKTHKIWDKQICAGGEKGKNACLGDSGGPLTTMSIANDPLSKSKTERSYQLGIISFGKNSCAGENQPAVYTRISSYLSWILDNLSE